VGAVVFDFDVGGCGGQVGNSAGVFEGGYVIDEESDFYAAACCVEDFVED